MSDDELKERLGPEIPANVRPRVQDYGFDLEEAPSSVLSIRTHIPDDAFTADTLGTERGGNAALISSDGLVVTIGYLVTEAETVWLFDGDGKGDPRPCRRIRSGDRFRPRAGPAEAGPAATGTRQF